MAEKHQGGTKRKGQHNDKSSSSSPKNKKYNKAEAEEDVSNSAKRRLLKKDRQSHRRHADIVNDAKSIWNKLRLKNADVKEREELMDQLMILIRGKMNEIALQHDASRVVQAAIQFGTPSQRKEILTELCQSSGDESAAENLPELSKIQYAHFVTLKLIKYCARDDECVKMIVKSFKGTMPKLAVHSVAARVLESLFTNFPPKSTASLKQEFYGPHFSLFFTDITNKSKKNKNGKGAPNNSAIPTLKSNLELDNTSETQKKAAIDFVRDLINKGLTKGFFGHKYFQELVAEYVEVVTPNDIRDMAPSIVDHSIHMLSTRPGARVVAACASYGTPKDRKRMLKSLKGYARAGLLHKDAYLALLRLIQVTDDTVSTNKSLLNELVTLPKDAQQGDDNDDKEEASPLLELALDETASKLFLLLMVQDDEARMKYFDPYERSILESQPVIVEKGKEVPTSKKDPQNRWQELMQYLSPSLVELCSNGDNAKQLIRSLPGSRVLKEVYAADLASEQVANAIIDVCVNALEDGGEEIFEDPVGHRLVKNIILCDAQRTDETKALFSKAFMEQLGDKLLDVAKSNRGAFVVAALLKVPAVQEDVKDKLNPTSKNGKQIKKLCKAKNADTPTAGYEALWKELSSSE